MPRRDFFRFWPSATELALQADAGISKTVVLFRHIEKTGGVSLRSSFHSSACQYFGYQLYWTTCYRLAKFIHNHSAFDGIPKPAWERNHAGSRHVACVEARVRSWDLQLIDMHV